MRAGSDMMIESEIRGEKEPVDARMNARERPRREDAERKEGGRRVVL